MKKGFLVISIVLFLVSCEKQEDWQTVTIQDKFSINLPTSLTKTNQLAPDALLQYQNTAKELYVVVINDPKRNLYSVLNWDKNEKGLLDEYSEQAKMGIQQKLINPNFSPLESIHINGLNARKFTVTGIKNNHRGYYEIAYVEGDNDVYQIHIWTKLDNKEKLSDVIKKIINSFKEQKNRTAKKRLPK